MLTLASAGDLADLRFGTSHSIAARQHEARPYSSVLWNAMVAPLTVGPLALHAVLWWQVSQVHRHLVWTASLLALFHASLRIRTCSTYPTVHLSAECRARMTTMAGSRSITTTPFRLCCVTGVSNLETVSRLRYPGARARFGAQRALCGARGRLDRCHLGDGPHERALALS